MASNSSESTSTTFRNGAGFVFYLFFAALALAGVWFLRVVSIPIVSDKLEAVAASNVFLEHPMPVRATYSGIKPLDGFLKLLVITFMNVIAGWDAATLPFTINFMVSWFPVLSIWAVESCRERNRRALTRFTYIYAIFYQFVGAAIMVPLYYIAYLYDTSDAAYWSKPSRVPLPYAKALLPALVISYLLPMTLMFLPYSDQHMWMTQLFVAIFQGNPWYADILIWVFSKFSSNSSESSIRVNDDASDLPYLQRIYITCMLVTSITHIYILYIIFVSPSPVHTFARMFLHPKYTSSIPDAGMTLVQGIHAILQADYWIFSVSCLLGAWVAVWDVKRVGVSRKDSPANVAVLMLTGSVLVGPATVLAAVWYRLEGMLAEAEEMGRKLKDR